MTQRHNTRAFEWMLRHPTLTFVLMAALFLSFGLLSMDLVKIVSANTSYILDYGLEGLWDGGLLQFFELMGTALIAVLTYLGFKLCEHALVECAAHHHRRSDDE